MIKLSGKVIRGQGYGRLLGFPTANIERRSYSKLRVKPKLGIWAGHVLIGKGLSLPAGQAGIKDKRYFAAIVIGPLEKTGLPKIEAHIIGFKGNLYGQHISIFLNTYLRLFKKFNKKSELKRQILKDVMQAKAYVGKQ